jgi:hypothetical protein
MGRRADTHQRLELGFRVRYLSESGLIGALACTLSPYHVRSHFSEGRQSPAYYSKIAIRFKTLSSRSRLISLTLVA